MNNFLVALVGALFWFMSGVVLYECIRSPQIDYLKQIGEGNIVGLYKDGNNNKFYGFMINGRMVILRAEPLNKDNENK